MTIVETLKIVLKTAEYGMTSKEAYDEIIRMIFVHFEQKIWKGGGSVQKRKRWKETWWAAMSKC